MDCWGKGGREIRLWLSHRQKNMSGLTEGVVYRWIGQVQLISVIKSLGLRDQLNVGNMGKVKYLVLFLSFWLG